MSQYAVQVCLLPPVLTGIARRMEERPDGMIPALLYSLAHGTVTNDDALDGLHSDVSVVSTWTRNGGE